jgi:phosphate starvation-inducible protein PhoH and related proteins
VLSSNVINQEFSLQSADNFRLADVCGHLDSHLRQIEQRLNVVIARRGSDFAVEGANGCVQAVRIVLQNLYDLSEQEEITPESVHLCLQDANIQQLLGPQPAEAELVRIQTKRGVIKGRGKNQQQYLSKILNHDINFGVGPAGTGKTYLAVACAIHALQNERVRRIVLVRPAVEAGEKLGFLPGDMAQKVDPYLRPLYDALYEMLGFERVEKMLEKNQIEVAPLAFMRGRTLNDAFIILDEAQNTTVEQIKMFLTRVGFGSTAVVTGDVTQIDLPNEKMSGLKHVLKVLKDVEGISFTYFGVADVVRHPLVQRIVAAYDAYEQQQASA